MNDNDNDRLILEAFCLLPRSEATFVCNKEAKHRHQADTFSLKTCFFYSVSCLQMNEQKSSMLGDHNETYHHLALQFVQKAIHMNGSGS